jgi:serine/threonine-protein kinase RsbW
MSSLSFSIGNDLEDLRKKLQQIDQFLIQNQISQPVHHDLLLGVEELSTNAIRYGFSQKNNHFIDITIQISPQEVILELIENGIEFNPLLHPEPVINQPVLDRKIGGLGIYLVKKSFDQLQYERKNGNNILILKKIIPSTAKN